MRIERIEGENRGPKKENDELCFESVRVVEGCFWSSEKKRFWVSDSILSQNCQLSVKPKEDWEGLLSMHFLKNCLRCYFSKLWEKNMKVEDLRSKRIELRNQGKGSVCI